MERVSPDAWTPDQVNLELREGRRGSAGIVVVKESLLQTFTYSGDGTRLHLEPNDRGVGAAQSWSSE